MQGCTQWYRPAVRFRLAKQQYRHYRPDPPPKKKTRLADKEGKLEEEEKLLTFRMVRSFHSQMWRQLSWRMFNKKLDNKTRVVKAEANGVLDS